MVGPSDIILYAEDHVARHLQNQAKGSVSEASPLEASSGDARGDRFEGAQDAFGFSGGGPEGARRNLDMPMTDAGAFGNNDDKPGYGAAAVSKESNGENPSNAHREGERAVGSLPGHDKDTNDATNKPIREENGTDEGMNGKRTESHIEDERGDKVMKDAEMTTDPRFEHRRSGEQSRSATSEAPEHTFIHPMFAAPAGAKPDRNLGLPEHEAEDIRRLLALYVQKQEEICRGATRLHHGLLKAERLRNDVLRWAKAEAHCGPDRDMSDGEDWYDKDEWGLTEDLKKGQDEEEEDTTTAGKKTRNRR